MFTSTRPKPKKLLRTLDALGLGHLVRSAAKCHFCRPKDILGRRRLQHIVEARHDVCVMLRERGLSYPAIGALMGMEHTSVMHACGAISRKRR